MSLLLPYQLRFINDPARIKICIKARRIGLSLTSRCWALLKALKTPNHRIFYLSRDQRKAELWLEDLGRMARALNVISPSYFDASKKNLSAGRLRLPNGSTIFAMPSSADALTGETGSAIVDEAALHRELGAVFRAAVPATSTGAGELLVFSSCRHGEFMDFVKKAEDKKLGNASVHRITIEDALDDGLLTVFNKGWQASGRQAKTKEEFIQELKDEIGSDLMFRQEFMCEPAPEMGAAAVTDDEIDSAMIEPSECYHAPMQGGRYFAGIDIGRDRDQTVAVILEQQGKRLILRDMLRILAPCPWEEQERRLLEFFARWKIREGYVDASGSGHMLAEQLARRIRGLRAEKWTVIMRLKFLGAFREAFRSGVIAIPRDSALREDIAAVEVRIDKWGRTDYWIPSRGQRGHGDSVCAIAQAVYSAWPEIMRAGGVKRDPTADIKPSAGYVPVNQRRQGY